MNDKQFATSMESIVAAIKERGYDLYAQLTGYITENGLYISPTIKERDS